MKLRSIGLAFLFLSLTTGTVSAKWMRFETQRVPIGRVLTNLYQRLATNTQRIETLYHLARVHSMAYATNLTAMPVKKNDGEPMFAHPGSDTGVPAKVFPPATPAAQGEARRHLTNAILYYNCAVGLLTKGINAEADRWLVVPINLGRAWCLDQAGRRSEAIEAYRDALHQAWRQEIIGDYILTERARWSWDRLRAGENPFGRPRRGYIGPGICYSEEIIGYLLKLLDPRKNAKEIAQLEADR